MKTGSRHADDTPADEEVKAHVRDGRHANDEGDDEVKAHVKSSK